MSTKCFAMYPVVSSTPHTLKLIDYLGVLWIRIVKLCEKQKFAIDLTTAKFKETSMWPRTDDVRLQAAQAQSAP